MSSRKFEPRMGRLEDRALLTGKGRYVDDIHLPNMIEVAFVRSPHGHALFHSIDATAALAHPGVHAVYTHADVVRTLTSDHIPPDQLIESFPATTWPYILPKDEVCFVGEAVAIVVADTRYIAEDAAALVEVDYEPLPVVSNCRQASVPESATVHRDADSNIVSHFTTEYGDTETAFAEAAHVFGFSLNQHRGGAHSIEGRGVVVNYDADAHHLTIWTSTQSAHKSRDAAVELFDMDESQVRVIVPDVGGGFGGKNTVYPEEILTIMASRLLARPVKWIEDRREHFIASIQERDQEWDIEVAVDTEARVQGVRGTIYHDQGAYTLLGLHVPHNSSIAVPGPYHLPSYSMEVIVSETNKVSSIPVRGAGYPEGNFAMERILDRISRELGVDRAEVRRRNLIPGEAIPYEMPMKTREGTPMIYESGNFTRCHEKALEAAGYEDFARLQQKARAEGRHIGIGVANMVKVTGRGPFESATVRVGRSGRVIVYTSAMAMGQGTKTALAQVCAEQLSIPPDQITVVTVDTASSPIGIGAYGSRTMVNAGNSVHLAAGEVRDKAIRVAAHVFEVEEKDIEIADGFARVKGDQAKSLTFKDIAKALGAAKGLAIPKDMPIGFEATVNFRPPDVTYCNASHVVQVEVDPETGGVEIVRYVVVNDSGTLINPTLVEGQLQGGIAHGIGNALYEWMGYDENAQPVITNLAEYLLPTSTTVPNIEIIHEETPSTLNPLGVKGAGESGVVAVAGAVISAVENALEPFGIWISDAPISPMRIVELIEESKAAG
ncbi:MAG: xanthine dehydrogenase family protein molybdopterin-binding subunit [Proteobacteria bacterium]|nr:xanthine dehydrogenase family protein molybdopterin-binding subunit [Pseudomonadota bacterium]